MKVNRELLNPTVNEIVDAVLMVKNDIPVQMIVTMVNYALAEMTASLRANLEWSTPSENSIHRIKTGIVINISGSNNHMAKITNEQATQIKYLYKGLSHVEVALKYGVNTNVVGRIRRGETWTSI